VKLTNSTFAGKMRGAVQSCDLFFFCGPDEAGASAAAADLIAALDDPGERVELSGGELRADPAKLGDEARSSSLFGDKRHIYARVSGDEAHDALKALIETSEAGASAPCPVIVIATSATDKSRTAKLLEKRKDALVTMFYPPDLGSVAQAVRKLGDAAGVQLAADLAERIARGAMLDVRLAASEVEKLALYLGASTQSPKRAETADLDAIGASSEEDGFMPLVNAVLSGDTGRLPEELKRMREVALNPVGVLLAIERRAAQLARIAAKLGPRGSLDRLGKGEKAQLGIFFREERDIRQQVRHWRGRRLDMLVLRLTEMHRELLTNSQSAETLLAQGLARIARSAAPRS
jgi:DNA polymerase-3 subunit delta